MLLKTQYIVTASTLVVIFMVGAVVVYNQTRQTSESVPQAVVVSVVQSTPAQIAEQYQVSLKVVTEKLFPLLDKTLLAGDKAVLTTIRDQLVALSVPLQAQTYHLQLVLKTSLLVELLTPGKVMAAASGGPTITSTQTELKKLLGSTPTLAQ